jgi:hypothetical protein
LLNFTPHDLVLLATVAVGGDHLTVHFAALQVTILDDHDAIDGVDVVQVVDEVALA